MPGLYGPYGSTESDGYPNDWIEPDGYPSDWIVPTSASARNINNMIAPAKAAASASVPYGSIESDGYPNDWIEQDGYPNDWIVPAQMRDLGGPYRASSNGLLATGQRPSSAASPLLSPQSRPQNGSGDSDASRSAYWTSPSAFQQQSPSRLVVPVSDQTATRPGWIPLGPGSGWEPWADQFIKGMQGLIILAQEYKQEEDYAASEVIYLHLFETKPDDPVPLIKLAEQKLYFESQHEAAMSIIDRAIEAAYDSGNFRRNALGVKARIAVVMQDFKIVEGVLIRIVQLGFEYGNIDVGFRRDFFDRLPPGSIDPEVARQYDEHCREADPIHERVLGLRP